MDACADDQLLSAEELQAEWEAELMRRIEETESGLGGEISGEEMRRIARETLEQ